MCRDQTSTSRTLSLGVGWSLYVLECRDDDDAKTGTLGRPCAGNPPPTHTHTFGCFSLLGSFPTI